MIIAGHSKKIVNISSHEYVTYGIAVVYTIVIMSKLMNIWGTVIV